MKRLRWMIANALSAQALGLALVRWPGIYEDVEAVWLRWATLAGELLPTREESLQAPAKLLD